jgi:hypothetical protein
VGRLFYSEIECTVLRILCLAVWALGMVYAFSCRTEYSHHNGKLYTKSVHLLVPFLGAPTDPSSVGGMYFGKLIFSEYVLDYALLNGEYI